MKKFIKYFLLFLFFLSCLLVAYTLNRGDTFVNYGFSYAIANNEIPYRDFNMVITPFSPFLYSIGLFINKSILTYYIEQALLLIILFVFLEKLLMKKSYLFIAILTIIFPVAFSSTIFPGYNFIAFLLLIITIYLEKNNKSDYLIGLVLGLIFCTKQTIGLFLIIPSIYYLFKNYPKFIKRIIGYLIPITIMFIYLLITKSLSYFINLCFLGLFNFGNKNSTYSTYYLFLLILGITYIIYRIIKDKKDIANYYFLLFSIVAIPIIDYYHVSLFLLGPIYLFINNLNIKDNYYKYIYIYILVFYLLGILSTRLFLGQWRITNYNNFPLSIESNNTYKIHLEINNYIKKLDKDIIFLARGSDNYFYKITNNKKITYFDLPNYGNYGYKGEEKLLNNIKNIHNSYILLDNTLCIKKDKYQQYICKKIGNYTIYYKEK